LAFIKEFRLKEKQKALERIAQTGEP
jgi:hypothetical protein